MGAGMVQVEVTRRNLLMTFEAMKLSGLAWPVVSEDVHAKCMQRLTVRVRVNEQLPDELADERVQRFFDDRVSTAAEKYLMLAVPNVLVRRLLRIDTPGWQK